MGFPRQEYWNRLSFPPLGDLSDPGIGPVSPALAGGFFFFLTTEPPGKPFPKCPPPHPLQKVYHFLHFSSPRFRFLLMHFRTLKAHTQRNTHTALKSKFPMCITPPPPGQQGPFDLTVYCSCIWPVSLPSRQVLCAKVLLS